jgi:hypothetical protein
VEDRWPLGAERRRDYLVRVGFERRPQCIDGVGEPRLLAHVGSKVAASPRYLRDARQDLLRVPGQCRGEDGVPALEQLCDAGSHQRVADPEVVEEGERLVAAHGREPQRELGELDGQRVEVHAVEAALGHETLNLEQR